MLLNDKRGLREPGLLGKATALLGAALLLILGFMFSLVLLAVAAVLVAGVWTYLWWKTRELRRQLRTMGPSTPAEDAPSGQVIEGQAVRVDNDDAGSARDR